MASVNATAGERRRTAAFFDVDETLITIKSMFSFLAFAMRVRGLPPEAYARVERRLLSLAATGTPRAEVNRAYFRLFAGQDAAATARYGTSWFAREKRRGQLFHPEVLACYRDHVAAGDLTVLVSGSFAACLDPLARMLRPDGVLCSAPTVREGRYTGEIVIPLIGEAKAQAVLGEAAARGIDLARSYAYGDHASDRVLLDLVGHPVVVGDDPVLTRHARRHGWTQLTCPSPAARTSSLVSDPR